MSVVFFVILSDLIHWSAGTPDWQLAKRHARFVSRRELAFV